MLLLDDDKLAEIERRGRARLLFTCGQSFRACDGCDDCWRNLLDLIREVGMETSTRPRPTETD